MQKNGSDPLNRAQSNACAKDMKNRHCSMLQRYCCLICSPIDQNHLPVVELSVLKWYNTSQCCSLCSVLDCAFLIPSKIVWSIRDMLRPIGVS